MTLTANRPLAAEFYARDTVAVARDLLGCVLESRIGAEAAIGRIVEVEAYVGPNDAAAHGYGNKKTRRNAALFGPPGTGYVYFIYGMHWCFNAVTEADGHPSAVLIRSLEPVSGIEVMCRRRGVTKPQLLCSGPARLCQALGIDGSVNGGSLQAGPVRILGGGCTGITVSVGPRIGISRAKTRPLRFVERDSAWLSRPAP
jgi:DNA-3-methyladenine glycosylase